MNASNAAEIGCAPKRADGLSVFSISGSSLSDMSAEQFETQTEVDPYSTQNLAQSLIDPTTLAENPVQSATVSHSIDLQIGNYEVEKELGRGGMGAVYLARHAKFRDRRYAVKLILGDTLSPDAIKRFQLEIDAIAKSRHPNLLYATDAGAHEGKPYLVTEFIEGLDLAKILKAQPMLKVADVCEISRQIALGLEFAHQAGIVHRDIKPQNVMLQPNGQVKILDLGLAAIRSAEAAKATEEKRIEGTPEYMPPEQWRGSEPAPTSDIYSLGCTMFCLLAGHAPYPVATYKNLRGLMQAHAEQPIPKIYELRRDVPADVAHLIQQCLAKDPLQRPTSCREIAELLEFHATPLDTSKLFPSSSTAATVTPLRSSFEFEDPGVNPSGRISYKWFVGIFIVCLSISIGSLALAYYGPGSTQVWSLRYDHLDNRPVSTGTGFVIESLRSILFLSSVIMLGYLRYLRPVMRFLSPKIQTLQAWIGRLVFIGLMSVFLNEEFSRHWYVDGAAAGMVAWAESLHPPITTEATLEVVPYRWYFGYSMIHYFFIFGVLMACPVLQFLLVDFRNITNRLSQFAKVQPDTENAMMALDQLHQFGIGIRQLAARYVDTAGVLAMGVQFEYWVGRYTLSPQGFAFEIRGMLTIACAMLLIFAFILWVYSRALDITVRSNSIVGDFRVAEKINQFNLVWFLKTALFTRLSGLTLLSLLVLAFLEAIQKSPH